MPEEALGVYLHQAALGAIGAGVRAIPIGHTHGQQVLARLRQSEPNGAQSLLAYLRTLQLACCHISKPPAVVKELAQRCDALFPHTDALVNRELAILLSHFRRTKVLDTAVHAKLLTAIEKSNGDRQQQIHYFYCLRFLHEGWTKEEKMRLLAWYGIPIEGKEAVVVGRSPMVGKPAALLLLAANATVTVCHSRTRRLPEVVRRGQIVVGAVGSPQLIKGHWIRDGAVVIDAGSHPGGVGDVELPAAGLNP